MVLDLIINLIHIEWMVNKPNNRSVGSTQLTRPVYPGHPVWLILRTFILEKGPGSKIYLSPHHSWGPFFFYIWSRAFLERNNLLNVCIFWVSNLRSPNLGLRLNMTLWLYHQAYWHWTCLWFRILLSTQYILNEESTSQKTGQLGQPNWPDQLTLVTGRD